MLIDHGNASFGKIKSSWHTDQEPQISEDNLIKSESSTHPNTVSIRNGKTHPRMWFLQSISPHLRHKTPHVIGLSAVGAIIAVSGVESVTCITKLQTI